MIGDKMGAVVHLKLSMSTKGTFETLCTVRPDTAGTLSDFEICVDDVVKLNTNGTKTIWTECKCEVGLIDTKLNTAGC